MNFAQIGLAVLLIASGCDVREGRDTAASQPAEASNMTANSHIPRDELVQMFDGIRQKTKWNIDGEMLWGYFFVDRGADRLKVIQRDLEQQRYRFVELHEREEMAAAQASSSCTSRRSKRTASIRSTRATGNWTRWRQSMACVNTTGWTWARRLRQRNR